MIVNGGPGDVRPGQGRELALNFRLDRPGQGHIVRHQHGAGHFVVLRLAQQVGGHPLRVALSVGHHQNLAGPGDHVDGHLAEDLALGLRHIGVAGAHDLVHPGHRLRAVGQGGHRLGSAAAEHPVHPGDVRRRQDHGVHVAAAGRGGDHDDLPAPGQLGGNGVHEDGGGVGGGASGDVEPHLLDGGDLLPQDHAVLLADHEALPPLAAVEVPDVGGGLLQNGPEPAV